MTMADHAGTKRISDVPPLTNTTGSDKGGHVMIKTSKHTTKPSKKLITKGAEATFDTSAQADFL
jgi:hypothetical protein